MAKAALAEAAMGGDPAARKIEERQAGTFADLAAEYLERHAKPNKRSWKEDERRIRSGGVRRYRWARLEDCQGLASPRAQLGRFSLMIDAKARKRWERMEKIFYSVADKTATERKKERKKEALG